MSMRGTRDAGKWIRNSSQRMDNVSWQLTGRTRWLPVVKDGGRISDSFVNLQQRAEF